MKTTRQLINDASTSHVNLSTFGAVIAILEGGCIYGGGNSERVAARMIKTAKAAMQHELHKHDKAVAAICSAAQTEGSQS